MKKETIKIIAAITLKVATVVLAIIMSVHGCFSQTQIDSLTAKRSIKLNGTRVTGISKDTTTANKRDTMLITEKAAKDYADKVAASSSGLDTSVADARYVRIQTQNPTGSLSGGGR